MSRLLLTFATILLSFAPKANGSDYLSEVKPLLESKCYACHGALKQQAGLRLDTAASIRKGGDSGFVVDLSSPDKSLLLKVVGQDANLRMPPENEGAPLQASEIAKIRSWIEQGAMGPDKEEPQTDPRTWWSYQPIHSSPLPQVKNSNWVRNPVDSFIASKREEMGLEPAAESSKEVWLRRVYLDLIGLPPTRSEQRQFLEDEGEAAFERVVDRLLASPKYGERWGRHWMDIWRYSDWYGSRSINEIRYSQRHIWRWRDWIVDAINSDRGYDAMIREMLAADEFPVSDVESVVGSDAKAWLDSIPATGYLGRNWYKFDRDVWLFDAVERTSEAFLGLTMRCARCHDHKFDPISQVDYFQMRAFFEPHDVRTDPISIETKMEKDATLGSVPSDGISLVFDKQQDAPTYRLERGDARYPDKSNPMMPNVPSSLRGTALTISPVELPPFIWYPALRPELNESYRKQADSKVTTAMEEWKVAKNKWQTAKAELESAKDLRSEGEPEQPKVVLREDFDELSKDRWEVVRGQWVSEGGELLLKEVGDFCTLVSKLEHPSDFSIRLRYRTLAPGAFRSVGFSFDYVDGGNSQDVYTSVNDSKPTVQAFHRIDGKQVYPPESIIPLPLKIEQPITIEATVRGKELQIDVDGKRAIVYTLPTHRRKGRIALWVHSGTAAFEELELRELVESIDSLQSKVDSASQAVVVSRGNLGLAMAEQRSIEDRLASDESRYFLGDEINRAAKSAQALKSETEAKWFQGAVEVLKQWTRDPKRIESGTKWSSQEIEEETEPSRLDLPHSKEELTQLIHLVRSSNLVSKETAESLKKFDTMASEPAEGKSYEPVGPQYPKTSTGRRRGLAEWIASKENVRTARVAVNHLWGKHFGEPLVATPENFGLNGRKPTHPLLLDWLADRLMAEDWQMKPIHRLIVLSSTYRMDSAIRESTFREKGESIDPNNQWLWRMNRRRMEAEVVRDSVLHLASQLESTMGGPEISETEGETVLRRSLYFRNTPNEKMPLLEVFDIADPNGCYRRKESVVPHQSLALMNSGILLDQSKRIAMRIMEELKENDSTQLPTRFTVASFETILSRKPTDLELARSLQFLREHASRSKEEDGGKFAVGGTAKLIGSSDPEASGRESLVHVLLLHNDFVTIR